MAFFAKEDQAQTKWILSSLDITKAGGGFNKKKGIVGFEEFDIRRRDDRTMYLSCINNRFEGESEHTEQLVRKEWRNNLQDVRMKISLYISTCTWTLWDAVKSVMFMVSKDPIQYNCPKQEVWQLEKSCDKMKQRTKGILKTRLLLIYTLQAGISHGLTSSEL